MTAAITLTYDDVTFSYEYLFEDDISPEESFDNPEAVVEIRARIEDGELAAWFRTVVTA